MALNLASLLDNSTRSFPGETALIADDERYTYERLDQAARRFAAELLDRGLERGQKADAAPPAKWPKMYDQAVAALAKIKSEDEAFA